MHFNIPSDLSGLQTSLGEFLDLIGPDRWWKRAYQLDDDARGSPYQTMIVTDHHWLEMELSFHASVAREHGQLVAKEVMPESMAALQFAAMIVEVSKRLSITGRTQLDGRLRDALKSGFSPIFLEMDIALSLLDEGFDIEFHDLEKKGLYDLYFQKDSVAGEVECKSISADAGRKIHRKDFYRLIDALDSDINTRLENHVEEVVVITVKDRLPSDVARQTALVVDVRRLFDDVTQREIHGDTYIIEHKPFDEELNLAAHASKRDVYAAFQRVFGENLHVSGGLGVQGKCVIVVKSLSKDDHSKPVLEALKKATSQLSSTRPGFIALQYNDIEPVDLTLPHLRRRSALLSNVTFHRTDAKHLAAVYYSAYKGLQAANGAIGKPAFVCWNPDFSGSLDDLPFRHGLPNSGFAQVLGIDPSKTDPNDYIYGIDT